MSCSILEENTLPLKKKSHPTYYHGWRSLCSLHSSLQRCCNPTSEEATIPSCGRGGVTDIGEEGVHLLHEAGSSGHGQGTMVVFVIVVVVIVIYVVIEMGIAPDDDTFIIVGYVGGRVIDVSTSCCCSDVVLRTHDRRQLFWIIVDSFLPSLMVINNSSTCQIM